jgi:hypothetical protein
MTDFFPHNYTAKAEEKTWERGEKLLTFLVTFSRLSFVSYHLSLSASARIILYSLLVYCVPGLSCCLRYSHSLHFHFLSRIASSHSRHGPNTVRLFAPLPLKSTPHPDSTLPHSRNYRPHFHVPQPGSLPTCLPACQPAIPYVLLPFHQLVWPPKAKM